ncbi:MAG: FAD-binding oxidoreductase [Acidiferrobacteraceae bacterium]
MARKLTVSHYRSWGNYPRCRQRVAPLDWRTDPLPGDARRGILPFGQGRSYGDSCLNDEGTIVPTHRLDHLIAFDAKTGLLHCESGVTLEQILALAVPRGWFLPVSPGTRFVSVGGAIANDIHGKNHHRAGTFGAHVREFELVRSDGSRLICSDSRNGDWYRATIGGLGLTGLITQAVIQLKPVPGPFMGVETVKFRSLDEFFELSRESCADYEYTVAWLDCLSRGRHFGRGHFIRANHVGATGPLPRQQARSVPFNVPELVLNPWAIKAFNALYYHRQRARHRFRICHYQPYFYPLDALRYWNRIYGARGFFQYQCVVPEGSERAITKLLTEITEAGEGSFLSVLKTFGTVPSPGLLSFPRAGTTLALDFPNRGKRTLRLLDRLDGIVGDEGGRVYPAKDARMSGDSFRRYFPQWETFSRYVDPGFSSSFWRRVSRPVTRCNYAQGTDPRRHVRDRAGDRAAVCG